MEILSLNGLWAFQTDADGTGAQQSWQAAAVPFAETMKVPGGWLLDESTTATTARRGTSAAFPSRRSRR